MQICKHTNIYCKTQMKQNSSIPILQALYINYNSNRYCKKSLHTYINLQVYYKPKFLSHNQQNNDVTVAAYMSVTHNISSSRLTTERIKRKLVVTVTKQNVT